MSVMKELTIGRDGETGKLRITVDKKSATFGEPGSVPKSVSQQHVSIAINDDGTLLLTNLNVNNDTQVNHKRVEAKRIVHGDRITLGGDHYRLSWDVIDPFVPRMADIRPLRQVWQDYQDQRLQMQIKERRFNALRSATSLITMGAVLLGGLGALLDGMGTVFKVLYWTFYGLGLVVAVAFVVVAVRESSRIPLRQQELTEQTKQRYKCPACGALLTLQDYDMLRQTKGCPHCQAKWIK